MRAFVNAKEIEEIIRANIDKGAHVVYVDGKRDELFVHTVDEEGFVVRHRHRNGGTATVCILGQIF